jgi:hypothetical protein
MMGPERAVSFYRSDVMQSDVVSASYYGEGEPGAARATYTQTITAVPTKSVTTVTYRKYVRPSDTETEEVYLKSMDPVITSKTSIGVPPHGYNYYTEKPNIPIRDFRASMWKTNYYVAKFYKDEKNDKALYGYNAGY